MRMNVMALILPVSEGAEGNAVALLQQYFEHHGCSEFTAMQSHVVKKLLKNAK